MLMELEEYCGLLFIFVLNCFVYA